jgi:hypothetical protein
VILIKIDEIHPKSPKFTINEGKFKINTQKHVMRTHKNTGKGKNFEKRVPKIA